MQMLTGKKGTRDYDQNRAFDGEKKRVRQLHVLRRCKGLRYVLFDSFGINLGFPTGVLKRVT